MAVNTADSGALFSSCRTWRYRLWRRVGGPGSRGTCLWVMMNPSTADEITNDPTIARTLDYSRRWGFLRSEVCNAFAFRSTNPKGLERTPDPVGPDNERHVRQAAAEADLIVVAWGVAGLLHGQGKRVERWLRDYTLHCLGTTKAGFPKHPLYLPASLRPVLYRRATHSR